MARVLTTTVGLGKRVRIQQTNNSPLDVVVADETASANYTLTAEVWVDPNYTGSSDGSIAKPYTSLTSAFLGLITTGGIIHLVPATYTGNVTIFSFGASTPTFTIVCDQESTEGTAAPVATISGNITWNQAGSFITFVRCRLTGSFNALGPAGSGFAEFRDCFGPATLTNTAANALSVLFTGSSRGDISAASVAGVVNIRGKVLGTNTVFPSNVTCDALELDHSELGNGITVTCATLLFQTALVAANNTKFPAAWTLTAPAADPVELRDAGTIESYLRSTTTLTNPITRRLAVCGPLEIDESRTTGFWDTTATDTFVELANGGPFVECTFGEWTAGDILAAEYWCSLRPFSALDAIDLITYVAVSLDAGATWSLLTPTGQLMAPGLNIPAGSAGGGSVACATKPIIRIGFRNGGGSHVKNDDSLGASLRCYRYAANAFVAAGALVAPP